MNENIVNHDDASTNISVEELEDLKLSYITTRDELNAAEQANILRASEWAHYRNRDVLKESFLKMLHKKMFKDVWKWAGKYRTTGRNIGIDAYRIPVEINALVDNVRYWILNQTFRPDEIVARFHHQLVFIHPFPNGNGRHARFATDMLVKSLGLEPLSWGRDDLTKASERRAKYIQALKAADAHDINPLIDFIRS
ncbi:MAG: mobile mystery protein B [Alphaproteobacteria bacterium]